MTELRIEPFVLPAADLGPENPLPSISKAHDLHAAVKTDETFHEEDKENLGWGFPPSLLPYRFQDGFDRGRTPRAFQAWMRKPPCKKPRKSSFPGSAPWKMPFSGMENAFRT